MGWGGWGGQMNRGEERNHPTKETGTFEGMVNCAKFRCGDYYMFVLFFFRLSELNVCFKKNFQGNPIKNPGLHT